MPGIRSLSSHQVNGLVGGLVTELKANNVTVY